MPYRYPLSLYSQSHIHPENTMLPQYSQYTIPITCHLDSIDWKAHLRGCSILMDYLHKLNSINLTCLNETITNQSVIYLPFSFLTNYTSVVDFITLGQELSANPLGLFQESPWTSLQLWFYIKCTCLRYVDYSSIPFFYPSYVLFSDIEIFLFSNPGENKF